MAKKKSRAAIVAAKIRKVMRDNPRLTRKQAVGKAFGILRHKGKIRTKSKGRKKK